MTSGHIRRDSEHRRRRGIGRPLGLMAVVTLVLLVVSAGVAYGYMSLSGAGSAGSQAITLNAPTGGSATSPTSSSLAISWAAAAGLPTGGGYKVLRSTTTGGPYSAISTGSTGSCNQTSTVTSTATSCTDTGLSAGTIYYYVVESDYEAASTIWTSPATSQFSGATSGTPPAITSANTTTFTVGTSGSFTVTTTGSPTPALTNANFTNCTTSSLPTGVSFTDNGNGTARIASTSASPSGTTTFCVNASNGVSPNATQKFTLTIAGQAPTITSASSTTFVAGGAGSVTVTTTGTPAPTLTNSNFTGCSRSTLPSSVTFTDNGDGTGTIASTSSAAANTYTICINASNGVSPNATQKFTLTIDSGKLVITSNAVSGATSSSPNLGAITVERENGAGIPISSSSSLQVALSSSPSSGATFGTTQFDSTPNTTVTIPGFSSSTTFWYGSTSTGTPTITVSASGWLSDTQQETITTAPAGLGISLATSGSTGTPVISCGTPASSSSCNVTGVGNGGHVAFYVTFVNSSRGAVVYSMTQDSTITEGGNNTGNVTIDANASSSSPTSLTASHSGSSVKTSTLTFGPYTLTINVNS